MAEHHELVAEMSILEQMGTQERQKLAKKRRLQQLKKWGQREKEWTAKERQLNKRIANMLHAENNGLDLKQYTTYGSNQRPKRKQLPVTSNGRLSPAELNPTTATDANVSSVATSNSSKNLIRNKTNNNNSSNYTNHNNNSKAYAPKLNNQAGNGPKEPNGLTPSGRVHFNVGVMLLEAAARNDLDEVKRLLMLGVSPDSVNHDGLTALHQCCIDASEAIMNLLLEHGANVDARDTEQWTPLHAACTCGHLNLVKILVDHGADLLAVNGDGNMPFDICEDEATLDFIESQMVKRGVTQEMIDVTRASTEVQMISDLEKLVADGGDLDAPINDDGSTALHVAAANGYLPVVKFLLNNGVNVNACDRDQWQPLHGAACWGNEQHSKVIELLVESGANLTAKTVNDETVFDLCDNISLLEKLNQLKDELESKQAPETSTLKRTQSRTNSRVHSVRRTSVRDKNQISRREAREEALLRVESETFDGSAGTNATKTSIDVALIEREQHNSESRGALIDSQHPLPNGNRSQNGPSAVNNTTTNTNADEIDFATCEPYSGPESRSISGLSSQVEVSGKPAGGNCIPMEQHKKQHSADEGVRDDPTFDSSQTSSNQQSTVQLIPINYTLSNLKKHRSDLRMRTSSIGGAPSVSVSTVTVNGVTSNPNGNNQMLVTLGSQVSPALHGSASVDETNDRSESPNSSYRKFYGEPSEVIGTKMGRSRGKCCTII